MMIDYSLEIVLWYVVIQKVIRTNVCMDDWRMDVLADKLYRQLRDHHYCLTEVHKQVACSDITQHG